MAKSSNIDRVREHPVDVATRQKAAARRSTCPTDPNRRANVFGIKSGLEPHHAAKLKVAPEELANELRDVKGAIFHPISEWDSAAHPDASLFRSGNFVPDALARNFALELRKRQQHVEGQTSHAGGFIEGLGHRYERGVVFVEQLDELGEVGQRPCQPVDLVDDDDIDPSRANVIQQPCQGRPVYGTARKATIVITISDQLPAFVSLTPDIGLRRFSLIVERVKPLFQSILGRDTSINRAARARFAALPIHGRQNALAAPS